MTTITNTTTVARNIPLLVGGALAVAGIGLAAGMALRSAPAEPAQLPAPVAAVAAPVAPAAKPAPARKATTEARAGNTTRERSNTTPLDTQPAVAAAPVCANCGVVDSVRSFEKKGEGSGLGAVAGGVIGGALGNQVGGGNGRKAMTVIGAIGGGMAGHEVEKRAKSETFYEVRVRMDDGTTRTVTQKTAPTAGARVVVDGDTLRAAPAESAGDAPKMMRASART
jgi:outer membrane lipoprotein SlyB